MKATNKIHYVYKITNLNPTDERLYYIGVRSTIKASAELDTNYRSSSKYLKEAIKEIGYNMFEKEILSTWKTRKEAVQEEIRLHNLFDVAKNKSFYNMVKQTKTGFDSSGLVSIVCKSTNITLKIYVDSFDEQLHRFISTGYVNVIDTRSNKRLKVSKIDFDKNQYFIGCTTAQVTVRDLNNDEIKNVSIIAYKNSNHLEQCTKHTITVFDLITNSTKRVPLDEYKKFDNYVNINSKKISIYDNEDNIVKVIYGNFKEVCVEENYPFNALKLSYQDNGSRIYQSNTYHKASRTQEEFKGWYAVKETLR